eukprot:1153203-Pelagomonas_calceolata.AAC.5
MKVGAGDAWLSMAEHGGAGDAWLSMAEHGEHRGAGGAWLSMVEVGMLMVACMTYREDRSPSVLQLEHT